MPFSVDEGTGTYDVDGNLSHTASRNHTYDHQNHFVSVNDLIIIDPATHKYDALGRRIELPPGEREEAVDTRCYYDGGHLI